MNKTFTRESISEEFLSKFFSEFSSQKINDLISNFSSNEHYCDNDILFNILNSASSTELISNFSKADKNSKLMDLRTVIPLVFKKYLPKFVFFLQKNFPNYSIVPFEAFIYPKNGYMGWHTNADTPYLRCYITYSENGDSYFKYRDPSTKEIIIDRDNVGWTVRYFKISDKPDELLWHCVYSNTTRISIGFRIINNLIA